MPRASKLIETQYKNKKHLLTSMAEAKKYGFPGKKLKVIGVTGTDGKTTTSHLIYSILRKSGKKTALVSSVAAYIGDKAIETGLHTTTPDAKILQPLLKKFLDNKIEYVILEVTSHGLDQHRVWGVDFLAGVLTNITHEHLDYHKSFDNYKKAKAKLFKNIKIAVLPKDDKSFQFFAHNTSKNGKIISFGLKKEADFKADFIQKKEGSEISINGQKIKSKLQGKYNAYNITAASALCRSLGISWEKIKKAVEEFQGVAGRMEVIQNKPFKVIVDFAHTPAALSFALETLRNQSKGKLIAVFGAAGERDFKKRPMMGKIAAERADIAILTAEDPRTEDPDKILEQIARGAKAAGAKEITVEEFYKKGVPKKNKWFIKIPERGEAIAFAIDRIARKGDIVSIFGKGHEKSLAFEKFEHPWSDQIYAQNILKADPSLGVIVLAGGKGTRMKSEIPKVLHKIAGRPMLAYTLENLRNALFRIIVLIVSYKKEEVLKRLGGTVDFAIQPETLGTGHAPRFGLKVLPEKIQTVVVMMADDSAFYTPKLLDHLVKKHTLSKAKMTIATIKKKDAGVVGYIQRAKNGKLLGIKEWRLEKAPPPEQGEVNGGLYVFDRNWLEKNISKLPKNPNGEYFITDLVSLGVSQKEKIQGVPIPEEEWFGVNTAQELEAANQKMVKKLQKILQNPL